MYAILYSIYNLQELARIDTFFYQTIRILFPKPSVVCPVNTESSIKTKYANEAASCSGHYL